MHVQLFSSDKRVKFSASYAGITAHAAKNIGSDKGSGLATYILEKGKPLTVFVK